MQITPMVNEIKEADFVYLNDAMLSPFSLAILNSSFAFLSLSSK